MKMFKMATHEFEYTNRPIIWQVLPAFDILDDGLMRIIDNGQVQRNGKIIKHANPEFKPYHDTIRYLAIQGLAPLNKYYSATDEAVFARGGLGECRYTKLFIASLNLFLRSTSSQL
jgi:hypothetical protein